MNYLNSYIFELTHESKVCIYFPFPGTWILCLPPLTGFILIQIFSKHSGIGVSPDSVTYLSAARHMAAGNRI